MLLRLFGGHSLGGSGNDELLAVPERLLGLGEAGDDELKVFQLLTLSLAARVTTRLKLSESDFVDGGAD